MKSNLLNKFVLLASFLSLASVEAQSLASTSSNLPEGASLEIFLLAGQSNMEGRALLQGEQTTDDRVWAVTQGGGWQIARDPLHFDHGANKLRVGPGRSFAIELANDNDDVLVGLVPTAAGGKTIEEWQRGGTLYGIAIARTRAAMERGQLKAVLWHQGESDANHKKRAKSYAAKLEKLIKDMRRDLNAPQLPFIVGELGRFLEPQKFPYATHINASLHQLAAKDPLIRCVSSAGLTDLGDKLHFDLASQIELGKRYATAYRSLF